MPGFALSGKLIAKPGQRDDLAQILLQAADALGNLPGCNLYIVNIAEDDPDAVWVIELWDSEEDHAGSLQQEGIRELIQKGLPMIAGMPEQVRLTPIGGKFSSGTAPP